MIIEVFFFCLSNQFCIYIYCMFLWWSRACHKAWDSMLVLDLVWNFRFSFLLRLMISLTFTSYLIFFICWLYILKAHIYSTSRNDISAFLKQAHQYRTLYTVLLFDVNYVMKHPIPANKNKIRYTYLPQILPIQISVKLFSHRSYFYI